jgi:hypothetical protein
VVVRGTFAAPSGERRDPWQATGTPAASARPADGKAVRTRRPEEFGDWGFLPHRQETCRPAARRTGRGANTWPDKELAAARLVDAAAQTDALLTYISAHIDTR